MRQQKQVSTLTGQGGSINTAHARQRMKSGSTVEQMQSMRLKQHPQQLFRADLPGRCMCCRYRRSALQHDGCYERQCASMQDRGPGATHLQRVAVPE